jgi:isopentenyl diphosphate isomerase/L-lactate dehydrogenase-like FMN-dependent dehydrogenase
MMVSSLAILAFGLFAAAQAAVIDQELDEGIADTGLNTGPWTTGTVPPLTDMITVNDFQIAAKNSLAPRDYAYYRTGALDEITYIKNLKIWEKLRLNGFSFNDVSNVNLATTILGYNFSAPFFIGPAASAGRGHPNGEANLARAAAAAGLLYVPSISATLEIEEIAAAAAPGQIMFHQEYIWANETRVRDELARFESNGFRAIFLTVDNTGVTGIRNRNQRFSNSGESAHSSTFTLEALNRFRSLTSLPVVPKGVKTAHDVKVCADLGFPAVYLSNHGGRQVDGVPTAIEILLDVHAQYPEVFDQIEIYADGGVRRGTHILALLALGVRAVGLGRSPMFANVFGEAGITRMVDILRTEMITEMRSLGQADINRYRGNTTFINTKQIELEHFGAPLTVPTSSTPFFHAQPPSGDDVALGVIEGDEPLGP